MGKRWLPKDRILIRALYGLIAFVLCLGVAGGLRAWDAYRHGWPEKEPKSLARTVWQYGPTSQEAANAVKQAAETGYAKEVVALLDPATGKAIAAWPADMVGKKPEEMTLASGVKLPPLDLLRYRQQFAMHKAGTGEEGLSVRLTPLYPWSGEGDEKEPNWKHDRRGPGGKLAAPNPQAFLLIAAPRPGLNPLLVLAAVAGALSAIGFTVYWLSLAWWVFADVRRRGGNAFAWGVLVLLTNLVGVVVYLIVRQQQLHCDSCGKPVERSFNHCPHCGSGLKQVCGKCGQTLRRDWAYCADCGSPKESPDSGEQA